MAWVGKQALTVFGVALVVLVGIAVIALGPVVAQGLMKLPWLIHMYTGGEAPPESLQSDGPEGLEPLPLEVSSVTGAELVEMGIPVGLQAEYFALPAEGTFPAGHFMTEAADVLVLSSRSALWSWDTGSVGFGVEVKIVELPTAKWADSLANFWSEGEHGPGEYPEGATVSYQSEQGEEAVELGRVQFVHDRLLVVVQVGAGSAYLDAVQAGTVPHVDTMDAARQVALATDAGLPDLRDLEGWETLPLPDVRPLHAASFAVAATLTILARGLGSSVIDRGARESLASAIRRMAPRAEDVDLRLAVGRERRRSLLRTLTISLLAGCGAILFYFVGAPLSVLNERIGAPGFILDLAAVSVVVAVITAFRARFSRSNSAHHGLPRRWRRAETIAAVLSSLMLTVGIFWVGAAGIGFATGDAAIVRVLALIMLAGGLAVVGFAATPARWVRRISMPAIRRSLEEDSRAPVLFLRSFQDDDLRIRIRSSSRGNVSERLALLDDSTFEDHLAWVASRTGPVIAIGQPGTIVQPLGAVRDYFNDDAWQLAVLKRINQSAAVVYVVGRSPGAQWELSAIRERGALGKTVFVFPPVGAGEFAARGKVLAAGLGLDPAGAFGDTHDGTTLGAIRIDRDRGLVRYLVDGRDDIAYDRAVSRALEDASKASLGHFDLHTSFSSEQLRREADSLLITYDPRRRKSGSTDPFRRSADFFLNVSRIWV